MDLTTSTNVPMESLTLNDQTITTSETTITNHTHEEPPLMIDTSDLTIPLEEELDVAYHGEYESDPKDIQSIEIEIGPKHFQYLKLLGEGGFGKVVLVQHVFTKEYYAMKIMSKKLIKKKNNIRYMQSERDILTKIAHPFLITLHYSFQTTCKLYLVMNFLYGGELFYHLKRRGLISEIEIRFYLSEMILAIEFLHQFNIIHRDLKPENVLLRNDAHVCITDFGLAKEIVDGNPLKTLCGTAEYMAPEMLTRNGYSKGVDWWALGALCYEMLVGKPPFVAKTTKELEKKILTERFTTPSYLTSNVHSLLKGMLEKDSNKRLGNTKSTMFQIGGVTALKQHPFFESVDWIAMANLEIDPPFDLQNTKYEMNTTVSMAGSINNNINNNTNTTNNNANHNNANHDKNKVHGKKGTHPVGHPNNQNKTTTNLSTATVATIESSTTGTFLTSVPTPSLPSIKQLELKSASTTIDVEEYLQFFDRGFTEQTLSMSILEENLQETIKSSEDMLKNNEKESLEEGDYYENFAFASKPTYVSPNELKEFEDIYQQKYTKLQKKLILQRKKQDEKSKQLLKEKDLQLKNKEKLKWKQAIIELYKQKYQEFSTYNHELLLVYQQTKEKITQYNEKLGMFLEQMNENAKKIKGLQKKIREIDDLKAKFQAAELATGKKPTIDKDQQLKLSKETDLLHELNEYMKKETQYLQSFCLTTFPNQTKYDNFDFFLEETKQNWKNLIPLTEPNYPEYKEVHEKWNYLTIQDIPSDDENDINVAFEKQLLNDYEKKQKKQGNVEDLSEKKNNNQKNTETLIEKSKEEINIETKDKVNTTNTTEKETETKNSNDIPPSLTPVTTSPQTVSQASNSESTSPVVKPMLNASSDGKYRPPVPSSTVSSVVPPSTSSGQRSPWTTSGGSTSATSWRAWDNKSPNYATPSATSPKFFTPSGPSPAVTSEPAFFPPSPTTSSNSFSTLNATTTIKPTPSTATVTSTAPKTWSTLLARGSNSSSPPPVPSLSVPPKPATTNTTSTTTAWGSKPATTTSTTKETKKNTDDDDAWNVVSTTSKKSTTSSTSSKKK